MRTSTFEVARAFAKTNELDRKTALNAEMIIFAFALNLGFIEWPGYRMKKRVAACCLINCTQ